MQFSKCILINFAAEAAKNLVSGKGVMQFSKCILVNLAAEGGDFFVFGEGIMQFSKGVLRRRRAKNHPNLGSGPKK